MLGIILGTLCFAGLFQVLRGGHGWRRYGGPWGGYGMGHGYGVHPGHVCGPGGWHAGPYGGRRRGLHRLLARLDATPGQEKVIAEEWDGLREALRGSGRAMRQSGATAADLLRGEHLEAGALQDLWAQHDALMGSLRERLGASVARVHDALDASQRKRLADWLERGL